MVDGTLQIGALEVDVRSAPLYVVRYRKGYTAQDVSNVVVWMGDRAARRGKIAVVHDLRRVTAPASPADRLAIITKTKEVTAVVNEYIAATAVVVPNALIHGAVTASFWIFRPSYPIESFRSFEDAKRWAQSKLDAA